MGISKIEWTDRTWNPVTGCSKISEACENCYAERMSKRLKGRFGYPEDEPFRVTFHPERMNQPIEWKEAQKVFVCSMGDLFHGHVPDRTIFKIFNMVFRTPHTFLFLTKRPLRMKTFIESWKDSHGNLLSPQINRIWFGVTVENQKRADERTPVLLQIPAAVRFISLEPMLEPIELERFLGEERYESCEGCKATPVRGHPYCPGNHEVGGIDLVICGGETGPGARHMNPDWARDIRDQCEKAEVPFFFKQMSRKASIPEDLMVRQWPE
jgi:protein gp37